jgi:hypothetical protein
MLFPQESFKHTNALKNRYLQLNKFNCLIISNLIYACFDVTTADQRLNAVDYCMLELIC